MNCGKSTALLQVAYNYKEKNMKALLAKPSIDTKGNRDIVSRIGVREESDVVFSDCDNLINIVRLWQQDNDKIHCILIDEAQFLTPKQAERLLYIAHKDNIPVMCYGLRTDFQVKGFLGSTRLLQIADELKELKTICECGKKATINIRLVDGKPTMSGKQVVIDGVNNTEYLSVCADCFLRMFPENFM